VAELVEPEAMAVVEREEPEQYQALPEQQTLAVAAVAAGMGHNPGLMVVQVL
jgi:hypothetical protein